MHLGKGDAALPLRHPAAGVGHHDRHEDADVVGDGLVHAVPYTCTPMTREDHDVDRPAGLERLPVHLDETILNSGLTDDAIAVHRDPDRYLVAVLRPERVIQELPGPP